MSYRFLPGRAALLFVGAATVAAAVALTAPQVSAQGPGGGQPPQGSPWGTAPIDLTGYWVSVVNEDWRWRMVTPPKGDVASVPLNDAARKVADSWDPASDGSCLAYGAGAGMRNPTRLHVTWEADNILKIDMDAGVQTRRLMFAADAQPGARSLQGFSKAEWERVGGGRGAAPQGGNLKVVTNNLTAGWLRKNGVPYSQNASVNEYFDRFQAPNGDQWLVVTTIVEDAMYLNQPFVTSTHFKKEPDGAKWSPAPCKPTT
ncbi:MAG: hypothetical protein FJW14_14280 [Acidimicrobiia bacterium]|nr:hypothetical protein [Acidimicrobiia bacterium]